MKKSLIALAVAGLVSAPAFAATSNVDVYGVMHIDLSDSNVKGQDIQVADRVSRFGFKGSEDLGGGLKALWQIETGVGGNKNLVGNGGEVANRNTFIGLAGGFGTVLMGRHDTPYKLATGSLDPFADTIADYNYGGVGFTKAALDQLGVDLGATADERALLDNVGTYGYINAAHDHRSPAAIAYISPNMSGLTVAGAVVASNQGAALNSGDSFDALSLMATYANGPLFASLAYQDVKLLDSQAWKAGVGYTFGDAKIGFIYEDNKIDVLDAGIDADTMYLTGQYTMGPIVLKAAVGKVEVEDADGTKFTIGADYNLSKRTTAYFAYDSDKSDRIDHDGVDYLATDKAIKTWSIGVKHSF